MAQHNISSENEHSSKFELFLKLPTELRLRIWEYSYPEPREPCCMDCCFRGENLPKNRLISGLLTACRESRALALSKHFIKEMRVVEKSTLPMSLRKHLGVIRLHAAEFDFLWDEVFTYGPPFEAIAQDWALAFASMVCLGEVENWKTWRLSRRRNQEV
jgi:hypothetical protein